MDFHMVFLKIMPGRLSRWTSRGIVFNICPRVFIFFLITFFVNLIIFKTDSNKYEEKGQIIFNCRYILIFSNLSKSVFYQVALETLCKAVIPIKNSQY